MPGPQEKGRVLSDELLDAPDLGWPESMAILQAHRLEPVLGVVGITFYVDVRRLISIPRVEEEPVGS
jgi:hypothetical protein